MSDPPPDRPWTEAEWERFFYESEVRAARYGDLLETLHDRPDCEELVAREMGWDDDPEPDDDDDPGSFLDDESLEDDDPEDEFFASGADSDDEEGDDDEFPELPNRFDRRTIPGYAAAFDWGIHVHKALAPLERSWTEDQPPEPDDPLLIASGQCFVVAVKIAGGHAMSRHAEENLCANIVRCRQALAACQATLAALQQLRNQGLVSAETTAPLLEEGVALGQLLEDLISEMRSRVWWE